MKLFALILGLFAVLTAHARELKLFERPVGSLVHEVVAGFAVNERLGRVWVKVGFTSYDFENEADEFLLRVPGLSLDRAGENIVLERDGMLIECARLEKRGRWIFRHTRLVPTGRCELKARMLRLKKTRRAQVFFVFE